MNRETKFTTALVFSFLFLMIGALHMFRAGTEAEYLFYYLLTVSSAVISIILIHRMRMGKNEKMKEAVNNGLEYRDSRKL
ncbi:hypothetical protein [Alkalicoccus saliphilus]|uniref:Uncharacterized protein n=1 Tax=Alkalicoccus saliphilus TaxID=200989 RepID=A0A2T4U980_9BACI|nr:hypothetical protein [Alkalicoccus saliphilus]PTL39964.1 hypothetical protein C6Y45_03035 [Alkalicoccus saliphilus]